MRDIAVGVIGAGAMGSAIPGRLRDGGCSVVVSLEGRSDQSRSRVSALGLTSVPTLHEIVAHSGTILAGVHPGKRRASQTFVSALNARPPQAAYVHRLQCGFASDGP